VFSIVCPSLRYYHFRAAFEPRMGTNGSQPLSTQTRVQIDRLIGRSFEAVVKIFRLLSQ
jgi:hypothetical protein